MRRPVSRPAAVLLVVLAAALPARRPAAADLPGVDPAWVEIATIEHARGDPSRLRPHLAPTADPEVRRRAIVALGRIGKRGDAPALVRELLARGGADALESLWAAALVRDKTLLPAVLPHLDADDPAVVAAAAEAVGFLGDPRADGFLLPLLDAADERVRAAAALAFGRTKTDRSLGRLSRLLADPSATVRQAAAAGAWLVARAKKEAQAPKEGPWEGDREGVARLTPALEDRDPDVRMLAARAIANLLPTTPDDPLSADVAALLVTDPDARVVADAIARVIEPRKGKRLLEHLAAALRHADPLVRERAAEALGAAETPEAAAVARQTVAAERDVRVREALVVAVARAGTDEDWAWASGGVLAGPGAPPAHDPVLRGLSSARILVAGLSRAGTPRRGADGVVRSLLELLRTKAPSKDEAATGRLDAPRVRAAVLDALKEEEVPDVGAFVRAGLADADPVVRATAAELAGAQAVVDALPDLAKAYDAATKDRLDADVRAAVTTAAGKIATKPDLPAAAAEPALALLRRALDDPAPTVRLAAREAAASTKLPDLVEASGREDPAPNDWRGLPRPKAPVLGIDLTAGGPYLSEEEALRLAAVVEAKAPRIVFDTDAGEIVFEVDARAAPVHALNLVLLASAKTYDGTTWHRVVPAFVIQGGDPRGDGAGDAGYSVPDEVNRLRYVRGALGMPKSTKDTGGCQVFVMHCAYPPLDGAYTCYGRVVSGLEALDRIRVGDRIRTARVVVP